MTSKPIFITGSDYGGKGYVYDMLKRHPQVFYRDKEWYWSGYQPKVERAFPDLSQPGEPKRLLVFHLEAIHAENKVLYPDILTGSSDAFALENADKLLPTLSDHPNHDTVFAAAMAWIAQLCGKAFFMQLATGQHIQRLADHLPDAKFIAVIRDPRNMLVSRKTRRKNIWKGDQFKPEQRRLKHHMTAYDPLWDSFSAKSDIRAMQQSLEVLPNQMRLFHHPQLVLDPEAGAHEICAFTDLPFDAQMLAVERRTSANYDAKKLVKDDSTPRYRRMLHPCEIAVSQWVLGKELTWLNYALDPIAIHHKVLAPFLLFRSAWDLWLRVFRRWSLRGSGYIVDMFKMYLRRFRSIWQG